MSNGGGDGTLGSPHKHTSAQVLLQMIPPRRTGFLRKRGKRERMLENIKFAKSLFSRLLRWRQRFVVVSHGCIYVFSSETASTPLTSFSLRGYNRLVVMESEQSPWTFRVTSPDEFAKIHYFACFSDDDRKAWMTAIREEMLLANDMPDDRASAGSVTSDVYVYLQRPVFEPPTTHVHDQDEGEESDDSDYDQIKEEDLERMRPRMPLPPTPDDKEYKQVIKPDKKTKPDKGKGKKDHDYVNGPKAKCVPPQPQKPAPNPKPAVKPKPRTRAPSEEEYYFPEKDREKALSILRTYPEKGTFLVRDSRASENKVLAVMTEDDIKEYKILKKDKKVTINNRDYYKSVEDLLVAYQKKPLPNRTTTLTRAYSSQNLHV